MRMKLGLEAAKSWWMELRLLKIAFGLPESGNPDAVKAIQQEENSTDCGPEIASNCGPDQGLSK